MCVCNRLGEKGSNEPIGMKLTWHKHCSFKHAISLDNSCFQLGHDAAQDV